MKVYFKILIVNWLNILKISQKFTYFLFAFSVLKDYKGLKFKLQNLKNILFI